MQHSVVTADQQRKERPKMTVNDAAFVALLILLALAFPACVDWAIERARRRKP
jgi:hypothetical protein